MRGGRRSLPSRLDVPVAGDFPGLEFFVDGVLDGFEIGGGVEFEGNGDFLKAFEVATAGAGNPDVGGAGGGLAGSFDACWADLAAGDVDGVAGVAVPEEAAVLDLTGVHGVVVRFGKLVVAEQDIGGGCGGVGLDEDVAGW